MPVDDWGIARVDDNTGPNDGGEIKCGLEHGFEDTEVSRLEVREFILIYLGRWIDEDVDVLD